MLVFDKHSLRCVVPPTEDCDVPTTPPPSPDELPENEDESNVPQQRPNQINQIRLTSQPVQRPQVSPQKPQQFQLPQQQQQQQQHQYQQQHSHQQVPQQIPLQQVQGSQQQSSSIPQQRRDETFAPPLPLRSRS